MVLDRDHASDPGTKAVICPKELATSEEHARGANGILQKHGAKFVHITVLEHGKAAESVTVLTGHVDRGGRCVVVEDCGRSFITVEDRIGGNEHYAPIISSPGSHSEQEEMHLLFTGTCMYRLLKGSLLPNVTWVRNLKRGALLRSALGVRVMVTLTVEVVVPVVDQMVCKWS